MGEITTESHIIIKGARVHNLKNVDVAIQRNKLTVVTGVSGSGKSSLAFDTLYAEGQRRYVESLSAYARLFLGRLDKPDVDHIKGISPAIAIEQKVNTSNPRSTVGTSTEIYDYLKLLFARVGKTISPFTGKQIKKDYPEDALKIFSTYPQETKALISCPLVIPKGRTTQKQLKILIEQGFSKLFFNGEIISISDAISNPKTEFEKALLIIDRITCSQSKENESRIIESSTAAFSEGNGICTLIVFEKTIKRHTLTNKFEEDGVVYAEPTVDFFSFNNPIGACPTCEGYGKVMGIDENLVIPNRNLTIYENAIACWRGEKMSQWKNDLIANVSDDQLPIHQPINKLSEAQYQLLWNGNENFHGIHSFFNYLESKSYKIQYRVMLSRYRGKTTCPSCNGTRLRKDAQHVKIGGHSITDICSQSIAEAKSFFDALSLNAHDKTIAERIVIEIKSRLDYLNNVGLGYLSLSRLSNSLSGGESQRINLATSLGSSLIGSMYILDEPSIGLHPRDTNRLIKVLRKLQEIGNSVIIVEHEEEIMRCADEIIDIGPFAGSNGGEIIFQGTSKELDKSSSSLTAQYLTKKIKIEVPKKRRKWKDFLFIESASANNLKNINVKIPLNIMTVVTGVSGSGKSSLVNDVLFNFIDRYLSSGIKKSINCIDIKGDLQLIDHIEFINQNPIGKSSRSNPVTYLKAFDEIRALFSNQHLSKINGFKSKHFSFNVPGGRCEDCEGEGTIKIGMQFMADVLLTCESCAGERYKQEVLEVRYKGKNISDVLKMTVDESLEFFSNTNDKFESKIFDKIKPLQDVGLGYVQLGQSSSTLSGGESQRIKMASFLGQRKTTKKTLFIFDEPTTGLHFHDIKTLLKALNALVDNGNHVVIIEHNSEIIKSADWVIDIGPEGGKEGGNIIFEGTPEKLVLCKNSYTGNYLKDKL